MGRMRPEALQPTQSGRNPPLGALHPGPGRAAPGLLGARISLPCDAHVMHVKGRRVRHSTQGT